MTKHIIHEITHYAASPGSTVEQALSEAIVMAFQSLERVSVSHNGTAYLIDPDVLLRRIITKAGVREP